MNTNAIDYDAFFTLLDKQLTGDDTAARNMAVEQLLNLTTAGDPAMRDYVADTLSEWLYRLTVPAKGRTLARMEDTVTRINAFRCYPAAFWQTDAGIRLGEAVEAFFAALREHQDAVAVAAYRPISDLLYFHHMGE